MNPASMSGLSNQWDKIVVRYAHTIYPYSLEVDPAADVYFPYYFFRISPHVVGF